jgi:salicylate hydroxylase
LESLGVLDKILQHSYIPSHASIRAWDTSELLSRQQLGDFMLKSYGAPFAVVHCYDLYRALFEVSRSIGVQIIFSREIVSVAPFIPSVTTSDGNVLKGDLVVGADGERSVCREAILRQPVSFKDSGAHVYRFMIPRSRVADVPHLSHLIKPPFINLILGPGGESMIYAVKRDEMLNVVLTKSHNEMEEPPMPPHPVDNAEVQEAFKGWSLIQDLLKLSSDTPCTR